MNEDIVTFDDYLYVYKSLNNVAQELLGKIEKALAADKEAFHSVSLSQEDCSITFLSCGFKITIAIVIKASTEFGSMSWYHIFFDDVEQRRRGKLICQQFFDYRGYIYKEKSKKGVLFRGIRGFDRYFQKAMLEIFQGIDEESG